MFRVAIETLDRVQEQLQAKLAQDSRARTSLFQRDTPLQHSPPQSPPRTASPLPQRSPSPLQLSPSFNHTTPPSTPPLPPSEPQNLFTQSPLVSPPHQASPPPSNSTGSSPVKHLTAQLASGTSTALDRTQAVEALNRMLGTKLDAREEVEDNSEQEEEAEESEEESMDEEEEDGHIFVHQSPCTSVSSSPHTTSPQERDSPISQISLPSIITSSPVSVTATSSSCSEDELPEEGKKTEDETEDSITFNETLEQVAVECDQPASHADGDHKPSESSPIEQRRRYNPNIPYALFLAPYKNSNFQYSLFVFSLRVKETPWTPVEMPNFFMPPHELEQTMRSLRAAALSRPQPRPLETAGNTSSHVHPPTTAGGGARMAPLELVCVSQTERDRIARIFSSSTNK